MDAVKYEQALQEIEAIAEKLESGNCEVDELSALVKRAKDLIKLCKDKLQHADDEVKEIIASDTAAH